VDDKDQELKQESFDSAIGPADVLREVANFCDRLEREDVADIVFSHWIYIDANDAYSDRWGATMYYMADKPTKDEAQI